MAEENPAEAAGNTPVLDVQADIGPFHIKIKINGQLLAAAFLGAGFLTLREFYNSNKEAVRSAVSIALARLADEVLSIRPSSLLVEFICNTKGRYHAFMEAYKTGIVKERLQEEFSKIGFKDELQVAIVDDNAPRTG